MIFDRVSLQNFKPYEDADLDLRDGVTVIHGLNGSGKSSLLEACFFALYGSKALDGTLDDVITNGEDEAEIDLWFTHDGAEFHIERRLRQSGDRTQTATCTLDGPDVHVEGARDVQGYVTDLLRMDAEAFVNCAYVRQGEVNKLINATPAQRQDMIDDLLQLGKLEEYRERASEARLGVSDVLADLRGRLSELDTQIEAKEDAGLHDRLNGLQSELNDVESDIERFEENEARAEETLQNAESILEEYDQRQETLSTLDEEIEALESKISAAERKRDSLRDQISERRETVDELRDELDSVVAETALESPDESAIDARLDELDDREDEVRERLTDAKMQAQAFENQASNLEESADEKAERAAEMREQVETLEATIADAESEIADLREKHDALGGDVEAAKAAFDDAPVAFGDAQTHLETLRADLEDLRTRQTEVTADLNAAKKRVEEAEELLDEGKCPECGQPVADSPHVDSLDADRERVAKLQETFDELTAERAELEAAIDRAETLREREREVDQLRTKRENVESRIEERQTALDEKRKQVGDLRERADELAEAANEQRTAAAEKREQAERKRAAVSELQADIDALDAKRDRLHTLQEIHADVEETEDEVGRLTDERENIAALNDERRDRLADMRTRRDELRDAFDEERIESARQDRARAEEYLEQVRSKLDDLSARRDELQASIGGVKQDISQLEELRESREELAVRVEALESLHAETEDLESLYGDLRADLRQRNVETLERLLNETFDLVYGNDAYAHIRLDGEYGLTVVQKDGQTLDPEQLSGGERALFNLSLRCAIYRLLAEGIEGAAPMPPLILDEPTVFLDSGHVSRLVRLVEEMRDLGVNQIVIVSHDEELVDAADDLIRVEKNPTTNRSSVERTVPTLGGD